MTCDGGGTPYRVDCFYCGDKHTSEFWDEIDAAVEECRQRASARMRGEVGQWVDDTIPIRCEASIPPDRPIEEQERAA